MKPIFRYILLTLAGVLVGFWFGHAWSKRTVGEGSKMMSQFLALKEYEVLTSLQYKESDPQRGREALLDLLSFMRRMETEEKLSAEIQRGVNLDRGITYMRLAVLDERAGNRESSKQFIRQAQASMKLEDASENHLREVVAKFDSTSHYMLPYVLIFRARMH